MSTFTAQIKYASIKPNGHCSNCNAVVKKTDIEDERFWYYPTHGIKRNKNNDSEEYIKCFNCKSLLAYKK